MSPRAADASVRDALLRSAAHLVAAGGPTALTLRRLAAEVGTSTMAVYTHFGSMEELRRAVRREAFARFGERLAAVERTEDPVADLTVLGWAYHRHALDDPDGYRAMFMGQPLADEDPLVGLETFEVLVAAVERATAAGRFAPGDVADRARQLWVLQHGVVSLQLVGVLSPDDALATWAASGAALLLRFGDDEEALGRSLEAAIGRGVGATEGPGPATSP